MKFRSPFTKHITSLKVINPSNKEIQVPLFAPAIYGFDNTYVVPTHVGGTEYRHIQSDLFIKEILVSSIIITTSGWNGDDSQGIESKISQEITPSNIYGKALSIIELQGKNIGGQSISFPIITDQYLTDRKNKERYDIGYVHKLNRETSLIIKVPPHTAFDISLFTDPLDYLSIFDGMNSWNKLARDISVLIEKCYKKMSELSEFLPFDIEVDNPLWRIKQAENTIYHQFHKMGRHLIKNKEKSDLVYLYNSTHQTITECVKLLNELNSDAFELDMKSYNWGKTKTKPEPTNNDLVKDVKLSKLKSDSSRRNRAKKSSKKKITKLKK